MNVVLRSTNPASPNPEASSHLLRRYLALWFPCLSTDRARRRHRYGERRDDRPFVLVEKDRGALRIAAIDAVAARLGLKTGLALAQARAVVPDLETGEMDRVADAALLETCAAACERFTPLVALHGQEGLLLDITGCTHLFGGEKGLLVQARRCLAEWGLSTSAAIAGTPQAAWAFARHDRNRIIPSAGMEVVARELPLAALEQDAETLIALSWAGFRSLGDLVERPSAMLTARFGAGVTDELGRVLGWEDIRITPIRPAPDIMAETHFPEPLGRMESLLAALERLAGDVSRMLERRGEGARAFEISFFRSDGIVRRLPIETALPSRDPLVLMRLARLRIDVLADPLDPGFGFDALRLAVLRSEALEQRQPGLEGEGARADEAAARAALIDRLITRFGRGSLCRFTSRDSHDPARAGTVIDCLSAIPASRWPEPEAGQPPARPVTLFAHPQPIDVLAEVPDSPPLRFRWRRVLHEVARAEGPERIAPEWWRAAPGGGDRPPLTRDYYRVEDAGGHRFWIFREGLYEDTNARPRWFLHGLFA